MTLQGNPWEITILPARGGRVLSLKLRGEELLDQGIGIDDPSADGFVEGGAFGWDEMVPNVEATDSLPDHGEAWRLPWEVHEHTASSIRMSCRGRLIPWRLERRIDLTDLVNVAYRYTNVGTEPHYAYWCAHPLFKYDELPYSAPRIRIGSSMKLFLANGSVDRFKLRSVELVWDARLTPYVGLWQCNGDLGGYRQIAIEPATGGNDKPDPEAPPPLLDPGQTYEWWLQIRAL